MRHAQKPTVGKIRINRVALGIVIATTLLFWTILQSVSPNFFLYDDNATQIIGIMKFHWISLFEHHEIPMINFNQYAGINHLGESQTGFFNPLSHLATGLSKLITGDFFWSFDILMLLHMLAGTLGMFFLLRCLRISKLLSGLLATIWLTTPYFVLIAKSWHTVGPIFAILPWSFLATLRFIQQPNSKNMWLMAIAKACTFYICHPQFAFIAYCAEIVYLIITFCFRFSGSPQSTSKVVTFFETTKKQKQKVLRYFFSWGLTLILVLPKLLTVLSAMAASARAEPLGIKKILQSSIEFDLFFKAQTGFLTLPAIFGSESVIYFIGLLIFTLFVSICFIARNTNIQGIWKPNTPTGFIAMAAGILLVAITFLVATQQPESSGYLLINTLGLSALVLLGRLILRALPKSGLDRKLILIFGSSALIMLLLGTKLYLLVSWLPIFDHFRWPFKHFHYALFFFLLFLGTFLQYLFIRLPAIRRKIIIGLLVATVLGNVTIAGVLGAGDRNTLGAFVFHSKYTEPFQAEIAKNSGRTLFFSESNGFRLNHQNAPDWLLFNFPTFWDSPALGGYFGLAPLVNRLVSLDDFKISTHFGVLRGESLKKAAIRNHLNTWSVRYLITDERPANRNIANDWPSLQQLAEQNGTLLYKNQKALPLVRIKSDNNKAIPYKTLTNSIVINPKNNQAEVLEIAVAPQPGYFYKIDNDKYHRLTIKKDTFPKPIQFEIPANTETVTITYRDEAFLLGLKLTLISLGFLFILDLYLRSRKTFHDQR